MEVVKLRQVETTGAKIRAELPCEWKEGETIDIDGIIMTCEQAAKITAVFMLDIALLIQGVKGSEDIVVNSELMPTGMWARFEPNGNFAFPDRTIVK